MKEDILLRFLECRASREEETAVMDWLDADPAHKKELELLDATYTLSLYHAMKHATTQSSAPRVRSLIWRRVVRRTVSVAALLALCFVTGYLLSNYRIDSIAGQVSKVEVPMGQRIRMTLVDGTVVWLNAGTTLEYPAAFLGSNRRVKLNGEAIFNVTHNAKQPFVVETFACDVEVLGTEFDVVADSATREFSATLFNGSVRVVNRESHEQIVLKPNESTCLRDGHLCRIDIKDSSEYQWPMGIINIGGLSFFEMMSRFEKAFGVKIIFKGQTVPNVNFDSGKLYVSAGIDNALKTLQYGCNFSYEVDPQTNIITIF